MTSSSNSTLLLCPVCQGNLIKYTSEKVYKCSENHSHDIAKEGYVNLLMCNKKKSKDPGDSKEMVVARKEFLEAGNYKELSDNISKIVLNCLEGLNLDRFNILDLGCGEGYYLNNLINFLKEKELKANYYGMDISRNAVRYAGKLNKQATWLVGNNFSIPLEDNSIDCIFSVFSPIDIEECNRVLRDNGVLVKVFPNANHLIQFKKIIYSEITDKSYEQYKVDTADMKFIQEQDVKFDVELNKKDIENLLEMTPHFWRVKEERKAQLYTYDSIVTTIDVCIGVFKKI